MRSRIRRWLRTPAGRLRAAWRLLVVAIGFLLVTLAVTVGALTLGIAVDPTRASGAALAGAIAVLVATGAAVTALVLVAGRYLDHRLLADLGWRFGRADATDLAAGLVVGAGLVGAAYGVGVALGVYRPAVAPAAPSGFPVVAWLGLLAVTMVAVGVYEELLLRGYVLTNLAEGCTAVLDRRGAVAAAVGVSSAAFGVLHGVNPSASRLSLATITLAGVMLGVAYVTTGSLSFPIGIHIAWNLTQVLLGLPVSGLEVPVRLVATTVSGDPLLHGGAFGPEGGLLGLGMTATGCVVAAAYGRRRHRAAWSDIAVPALNTERDD